MSDKSPDAFRTISEVADELDLPQHVLRFWETRFTQIKPLKRGGGRRYYRPEDISLLKGIRFLLYEEGYTIKGVQRILKEQGARHVSGIWLSESPDVATRPDQPDRPAPAVERAAEVPDAPTAAAETPRPAPQPQQEQRPRPAVQAAPVQTAPAAVTQPAPAAVRALSTEDIRQLKAAMFELIECKRVLDEIR